jgi:acetyl esterase/lipase
MQKIFPVMKSKVFKKLLRAIIAFLIISVLWILFPVSWSAINRDKPPLGYHFMFPDYIALWTGLESLVDMAPEIPPEIEEFRNIEYKNINGKSLQLDIYKPRELAGTAPLLVFIHGGAWKSGKRSDYLGYLIPFAKKGYVTATVSYRLLADSVYPACIEDITDAVDWFQAYHKNYGYDPQWIALIGGSAGGHLATLAGYGWGQKNQENDTSSLQLHNRDHRIKAVVDLYGPVDLTTDYARSHPLITAMIGKSYEDSPQLYAGASPVKYLDRDDPPTLIFHGTSDRLVPVSQSDDLKKSLDSLGIPCTYYRLPLWPHTMDIAERVNKFCQDKMDEFFRKYLN